MSKKYGRKIRIVISDEKGNKFYSWNLPFRLNKNPGVWVRSNGNRMLATECDFIIASEVSKKVRKAMRKLAVIG